MEEKYFENEKLEGLRITEEIIENHRFIDCEFIDCIIEGCKLEDCTFTGCKFYKCTITNVKSAFSQMRNSELKECNFVGINWGELVFTGKVAHTFSKIEKCRFKYNTFATVSFRKYDFRNSEFVRCMFAQCELQEANFRKCPLDSTEFFKCDLQKADFRDAIGYQVDIMTNKIKGASFSFPEAMNLLNGLGIVIE